MDGRMPTMPRWFCQGDYQGLMLYPGADHDVAEAGCGPCAVTHALISQGDDKVTPPDVVSALNERFPNHEWFTNGGGTGNGFLGPVAHERFGCEVRAFWPATGANQQSDSADPLAPTAAELVFDKVLTALEQGHSVVLSSHGDVFRGPDGRRYDSIGHYVCLYAFDDSGRILAADSSEQHDAAGPLTGPANPYTIEQARQLIDVSVAHPERHEVFELWR